jgi:sugar transferase EpsL
LEINKTIQKLIKRLTDICTSLALLLTLTPLLLLMAVLIAIMLGRPVLFQQQRPGLGGKPFNMLKFRSMTDARDESGALLPDAERLSGFGKILRATSMDELPELWNVLRGDMGLVGPRPLLMKYLPLYSSEQARRHQVRPGITGWAQVNGRNSVEWADKLSMDVWYVENRSFRLDCQICWLSFATVFRPKGTSHPDHATMPEFKGNLDSRDG